METGARPATLDPESGGEGRRTRQTAVWKGGKGQAKLGGWTAQSESHWRG